MEEYAIAFSTTLGTGPVQMIFHAFSKAKNKIFVTGMISSMAEGPEFDLDNGIVRP
jgi:hypothetical protein